MLELEKITGKNVWDILRLRVSEQQKTFVAGNDISIIEAYRHSGKRTRLPLRDICRKHAGRVFDDWI